jgi:hypothetical protein
MELRKQVIESNEVKITYLKNIQTQVTPIKRDSAMLNVIVATIDSHGLSRLSGVMISTNSLSLYAPDGRLILRQAHMTAKLSPVTDNNARDQGEYDVK